VASSLFLEGCTVDVSLIQPKARVASCISECFESNGPCLVRFAHLVSMGIETHTKLVNLNLPAGVGAVE
jgi:hypothetical protein